jgi:hypothetical protein
MSQSPRKGSTTTPRFLDGPKLTALARVLKIDMMYITKCKALEIPIEFTTYHTKAEIITLVNSGATDNFIDFRMVKKLQLRTKKLPRTRQLFNIDGTHNQVGLIEESIHLYVERGGECICYNLLFLFRFLDDSADSCDRVLLLPDSFV